MIDAEVARAPERRASGWRIVLDVRAIGGDPRSRPASGRVALSLRASQQPWARGDRLRGVLRLRRPRNFGNPGEFDYAGWMARRSVYVTAFAYDDAGLERLPGPGPGIFARWRADVARLMGEHGGASEAALLRALVVGMAADLPAGMREAFARAGVSHILAISGLHVGFVAATGYLVFRWLLARSEALLLWLVVPKVAAALSLLPVLLYAGIAGSNVATWRAVAMAVLALIGVVADRQRQLSVALAAAALGLIVLSPGVSAEVSFQLSFVAVGALLIATESFRRWWKPWADERLLHLQPRRARWLRGCLGYGLIAMTALLATMPLVALHFQRVSAMAPIANLVATPLLASIVVPLGLAAALLAPLSESAAGMLVRAAALPAGLAIAVVEAIAWLPWASMRVATPPWPSIAAFYTAAFAAVFASGRLRTGTIVAALLLGSGALALERLPRYLGSGVTVTFLSVGQGDSTIVEFPGGAVMVVDGGGLGSATFDVGERVVAPFLWSRGIRRVDVIVATHPQWDHYGGLAFLVEEFRPAEVWHSGVPGAGPRWLRFMAAVENSGARWMPVHRGHQRRWGDAQVHVLGPPPDHALGVNDASVVLAVEIAGRRLVLPGDVEARGEAALLAAGGERLRAEFLKVPHHGSATSSSARFVDAVRPRVAIVSAGRDNRFGFPQAVVRRRLRAVGAEIWRTDRHGAVTLGLRSDGAWAIRRGRSEHRVIDSL